MTKADPSRGSGVHAAKGQSGNLRRGRVSEQVRIYRVTTTKDSRQKLFGNVLLGRVVVSAIRHHDREGNTETLAYAVMPDHMHWLFSLNGNRSLDKVMHSMKSYSGKRIRETLGAGQEIVWQPGYHDHALRREEDLIHLARYVVANPVRAGLVVRLADYPLWDAKWI